MKLLVLQEDLSKALNLASRFTNAKIQLPILSNILLKTQDSKLNVSATNLESSISLNIGAKIESGGDITVPARVINDLVSNLNKGQLSLETDKEKLLIKNNGFESYISGLNSADFPSVPTKAGKGSVIFPEDKFLDALSKVLFAASSDDTRPVLTGILLILDKESLVMVATDGFRLSQKKINLEKSLKDGIRVIIPKNFLSELVRVVAGKDISFSFNKDENQVVFATSFCCLASRIIEGEFPDFEKIIPKAFKIKVKADKEELLQAVKLASVFARDSANVVKLLIGEGFIQFSAESSKYGSQETKVDAKIEGEEVKGFLTAFNFRFLEDLLNSFEGDEVEIELSEPNSPVSFINSKDSDFLHIIMPVRLQG